MRKNCKINILTIDVEDWNHAISKYVKVSLPSLPRIRYSLRRLLDLLDECNATATFFVLGEIALKHPDLVEMILEKGHEVGCHSYSHTHISDMSKDDFDRELGKATKLLKDISHEEILSFRAPMFSLTKGTSWALATIKKHGYIYDSSIFPTFHPFYGIPNAPTHPYRPSFMNFEKEDTKGEILEFPILTRKVLGFNLPVGGGAYLRFLGSNLMASAIRKANEEGWPATIYVHPWEVDDFIPNVRFNPAIKFITFYKVGKMQKSFMSLMKSFRFTSIRDFMQKTL